MRNKFWNFKVLDICSLSETKIIDTLINFHFFAEDYRMFQKDRNQNGVDLMLYLNEGIPGKLINSYDFTEGYKIIFEFSISSKKWLLLGNYKLPSQN